MAQKFLCFAILSKIFLAIFISWTNAFSRKVRLYHEGQRVGYLPPGGGGGGGGEKVLQGSEEASPLPPARLHLGSERLALTTVVSKSSFAIQVMSQIEKKK